jgi:hypothetical protein
MQCLNKNCNGHYEPICIKCEMSKPNWVRVEDKLPNCGERVLVHLDYGVDTVNFFDRFDVNQEVKYWMPLPKSPKN